MAPPDPILALYIEHREQLLSYANRIVRDQASAEDVVQEAWLRFSTRSGQDEQIAQPLAYLYTIIRNLALNWTAGGYLSQNQPRAVMVSLTADF